MEIFKPRGASTTRRPTDNNQMNGQIYNTPRYATMGGLTGPGKLSKNKMVVNKPGDGRKVI